MKLKLTQINNIIKFHYLNINKRISGLPIPSIEMNNIKSRLILIYYLWTIGKEFLSIKIALKNVFNSFITATVCNIITVWIFWEEPRIKRCTKRMLHWEGTLKKRTMQETDFTHFFFSKIPLCYSTSFSRSSIELLGNYFRFI